MLSRNLCAVKLEVFQIDGKVTHYPLGPPIPKRTSTRITSMKINIIA